MAHVEQKIKPSEKPDILREAVMTKTPDEIEKVYKSLGTVDFTAYALGLACRFRGLESRKKIPGFYKFFFENYEFVKINKGKTMKQMIDCGSVDGLAAAAELGWLKQPKKRDEMIAFAAEKGKTECVAWLLDFKNRTADLAAERERAEKKRSVN